MADGLEGSFIYIYVIGSIVATVIGFFTLWNIVRVSKRDTISDQAKLLEDMETRIKDHISSESRLTDTKLDNVRGEVRNVKEEIKKNDTQYRRELDGFSKWIERVERNVRSEIQRVTGSRKYYKSAAQPEEEE